MSVCGSVQNIINIQIEKKRVPPLVQGSTVLDLEATTTQTHCCATQTIPELFLRYGTEHKPAEGGHSHQGVLVPLKRIYGLQQCFGGR